MLCRTLSWPTSTKCVCVALQRVSGSRPPTPSSRWWRMTFVWFSTTCPTRWKLLTRKGCLRRVHSSFFFESPFFSLLCFMPNLDWCPQEEVKQLSDVRNLVNQLFEALNVGEHQLSKERELFSQLEKLKEQIAPLETVCCTPSLVLEHPHQFACCR